MALRKTPPKTAQERSWAKRGGETAQRWQITPDVADWPHTGQKGGLTTWTLR